MSTQTETIRKALRRAANLPELNLSNYNDDDVASLNGSVIVLGVEAMDALAALSELEAQPSQTKDLEAFFERLRFDKTRHIGLGDIRLTIADQDELLSLTRSVAQPSAPTVDQIADVRDSILRLMGYGVDMPNVEEIIIDLAKPPRT